LSEASGLALRIIKDTIHGYIEIRKQYFNKIIDTPVFQRLRGIEQTSMRGLYPCARHDRFSHSLGVYHLGKIAFEELIKNNSIIRDEDQEKREKWGNTFRIACLLHDCGHAPFSHTCEDYYCRENGIIGLKKELTDLVDSTDLTRDFIPVHPAPHELVSAIVLWHEYYDAIVELDGDPILAIRMMTGCSYDNPDKTKEQRLLNCIISILNGETFDVDKLDYTIRDTWASGIRNAAVDIPRLLSSLRLIEDGTRIQLCFDRSCVSVIKSLLMAKDYLYKWIYSHHKVKYNVTLIRICINELANKLSPGSPELALNSLFSTRSFWEPVSFRDEIIYLLSDGDLYYLMKKYKVDHYPELLDRKYKYSPLWKTYPDFKMYFNDFETDDIIAIKRHVSNGLLDRKLGCTEKTKCFIDDEIRHGAKMTSPSKIKICFGKKITTYDKLYNEKDLYRSPDYWQLFIHSDYSGRLHEIEVYLKSIP